MTDARWPGWPFPSTDKRVLPQPSDQQEPKLCECHGNGVELEEIADNKCLTCGKPLVVEAP